MKKAICGLLCRNYSSESGGVKYFGFTYYPRFPDRPDPPCEPQKLFMVERIRPVKGNPYWDKDMLKKLGLDGKVGVCTQSCRGDILPKKLLNPFTGAHYKPACVVYWSALLTADPVVLCCCHTRGVDGYGRYTWPRHQMGNCLD